MAEVTQQGTVRLAHRLPALFALGVVGFGERDGDLTGIVSGHYFCSGGGRGVGEEFEASPCSGSSDGVFSGKFHRNSE